MAVSIKNAETERLAWEFATRSGLSITEAVTVALRAQLAREAGKRRALAIGRRCAAWPDLDTRSADEILGYDKPGSPGWRAWRWDRRLGRPGDLPGEPEDEAFAAAIDADPRV